MRLQLTRLVPRVAVATALALASTFVGARARAQVAQVDTAHTLYHEAPTRSNGQPPG